MGVSGKYGAVAHVQLEDGVLCCRAARVRLQHDLHRREELSRFVAHARSAVEQELRTLDVQRVRGSIECAVGRGGTAEHLMEHGGRTDLSLQCGPI